MAPEDERTTGTPDDAAGTPEVEDRDDAQGVDGSDDFADDGDSGDEAGGSDSEQASGRDYRRLSKDLGRQLADTQRRLKELEAQGRGQSSATEVPARQQPATNDDEARQLQRDMQLEDELINGAPITEEHVRAKARLDRARAMLVYQQSQTVGRKVELNEIPAEERRHVEKLMDAGWTRGQALDFITELRGKKDKEADTTTEDTRKLREARRDAQPDTTRRGLTASEANGRINESTFYKKLADFDVSSPEGFRAKQEFAAKWRGKTKPG